MSGNELLLDVDILPDYGQIEISDVAGREVPESASVDGRTVFTDRTVFVYAGAVDRAVVDDTNVRVCVYRGSHAADLGSLVFDRDLDFTDPPRLGIYQPLTDEPKNGAGAVSLECTGPVHIQVFVNCDEVAREVNVLIRYDARVQHHERRSPPGQRPLWPTIQG